jgi:signal transduction histidine kinase
MSTLAMRAVEDNYHLTTRFGIISFIAVGITAFCIFLFYRYQTVQVIEDASRRSNEVLAIATEYALNDHFIMFLNFAGQKNMVSGNEVALGPTLDRAIQKLLLNTSVVRLKIYDGSGHVVYSTKQSQIGEGQEDNGGFIGAMNGHPTTVLIYRDTFNIFDNENEDENMVQTYVPIKLTTTGEVKGVFEVYSDISDYIDLSDRTIILVSVIIVIVMFFLYSFLLLHINRSERIIIAQNRETREKKKLLEFLTAKMINAQEDEKRRIALELHEDVVQTVSGVKMQLERYITSVEKISDESSIKQVTQDIVPILQEAAQKIRLVAMDLRPPSLDDFGLRAAVNSLVSECYTATTGMEIHVDIEVKESQLTQERKSILYRMLKDTLKSFCFERHLAGSIRFTLIKFDRQLLLKVKIVSDQFRSVSQTEIPQFLESMQERTILSGGDFSITYDNYECLEGKSVWNI